MEYLAWPGQLVELKKSGNRSIKIIINNNLYVVLDKWFTYFYRPRVHNAD